MKMADEGAEKSTSPKGKKRPSVILFGNHFALFLPSFLPVIHLVTTKNWMKMVDEGEEKVTSPKGKKRPSVILFGNHLALFLACFLPVIHLVTTKN